MKVLAYSSPGRGDLFPVVPVLQELQRGGHEVFVRTLAAAVPLLTELGLHADAISAQIEAFVPDDYRARSSVAAIRSSLSMFAQQAPYEIADLREAMDEVEPDLVLVDLNAWGAAAVAEQWGGPWARWCAYPLPLPAPDVPPFGPGFAPARGPLGRLRDRALAPVITGGFERVIIPKVNEVRRSVGLRPLDGISDLIACAPLTLAMTAEPFEYHRAQWPASVRLIGACPWEPPAEAPPWLDGVEAPVVLVSTSSSFQDDGRLVTCALEALRDEPVFVVATVPAQDVDDFAPPPNALVVGFTPHGPLLDRAVCAVTHGGMGATQKALARGVPVCAVPFGRDQFEVARRVEVCGAGVRLPARRLTTDRLRAGVRAARAMAGGARRVALGYERAGGAVAGARALQDLVASR